MSIKHSYGIACFTWDPTINEYKLLMVKKKTSYAFHALLQGQYSIDMEQLSTAISTMYSDERQLLKRGDFDKMWFHIYGEDPNTDYLSKRIKNFYVKCKNRYYINFGQNKKHIVDYIIDNAPFYKPKWEVPKGRIEPHESPMSCAIREFYEETGIEIHDYKIKSIHPYLFVKEDLQITYNSTYFIAESVDDCADFRIDAKEIADVEWIPRSQIKKYCRGSQSARFYLNLFDDIKKLTNTHIIRQY